MGLLEVKLLLIDDDAQVLELVRKVLAHEGVRIFTTTDPVTGVEIAQRERPSVILSDLAMPELNGMQILQRILEINPSADVVLMTAHYTVDEAVMAIRMGASDFLGKPFHPDVLLQRVNKLIEAARERLRLQELEREMLSTAEFEGMVGNSPTMQEVFARIRRVAPHFQSVLIYGATGTGKELVARALHALNPRAKGRFVEVNCAAVTETLFESEMFGHTRGSYTGADRDQSGVFEHADRGTLFLDEISEIPMTSQAKLLRALQNGEIQRVGSPSVRKVNVCLIAATNRDLKAMTRTKQFREDLYYRLAAIDIELPRLAAHIEDLPLLCRHFVQRYAHQYEKEILGIAPRAHKLLATYPWPGNIRELESCIAHACMMTDRTMLDIEDLPAHLRDRPAVPATGDATMSLAEVERRHAQRVLDSVGGNKSQAAAILGIGRATLYRILGDQEEETSRQTGAVQ